MGIRKLLIILGAMGLTLSAMADREQSLLRSWNFAKGDASTAKNWQQVTVPHDWAIYGPFDRENDIQEVQIVQNLQTKKYLNTGRTGGLPYIGKGVYRTTFNADSVGAKSYTLVFDGAMSEARVKLNGKEIGYWPYGYNSFFLDIDGAVREGKNELQVELENMPMSSRWYPGAGLYRNVHLVVTDPVHIPVWGQYITTPSVKADNASVKVVTDVKGLNDGDKYTVRCSIADASGNVVATDQHNYCYFTGVPNYQMLNVANPNLWSPENPALYTAKTEIIIDGKVKDTYSQRFGVRTIEVVPDKGFFLNGKPVKFKGVCNHHDLGPLGAAVNKAALRHQLELLKDMGCNSIRTSHNMPAPELVELCDEMGFMMMVESFDDWNKWLKSKNGYGIHFDEWAERDMVNMVRHYRNNASVVMWSIGNEIPNQGSPTGKKEEAFLQDICHREDPTRPVTCGMNQFEDVIYRGFAQIIDVPGFNYKENRYAEAMPYLPQRVILGSETASTISSRGVYKFPVELSNNVNHPDHQCSSYDVEACPWSNIPDISFVSIDTMACNMGEFVWTVFDYLGEPTPYDLDAWPNHSSMFGIIDLASIPKDRYYLYRSHWNTKDATLHILPHWNFPDRVGKVTPVFVYTSYPKAELFVNGKSQGVREKNDSTVMNRYRLMWNEVVYEPGEVKVVAYDSNGNKAAEKVMRTAGKPDHIVLTANRTELAADGDDLAYVTVQVADKNGIIVPTDNRLVEFEVKGAGTFRATANGDPTCVEPFQSPRIHLFSGAATAIVQSSDKKGLVTLKVKSKGVKSAVIQLYIK